MPKKHTEQVLPICKSDTNSPNEQTGFKAPATRLSPEVKGVWLEKGDYLGHFMDMQFAQFCTSSQSYLKMFQFRLKFHMHVKYL